MTPSRPESDEPGSPSAVARLVPIALSLVLVGFGVGALSQALWGFPFAGVAAAHAGEVEEAHPALGPDAASAVSAEGERTLVSPLVMWRPVREKRFTPDPVAGHVHLPHKRYVQPWAEHPDGEFVMQTNNLGFRESDDTALEPPAGGFRILVSGDSHTDGLHHNHESFPSQWEALLAQQSDRVPCEVLNGGAAHYGPFHYLGFLEKYAYLKPGLYVVVCYAGNDFMDAAKTVAFRRSLVITPRPAGYQERLEAGVAVHRSVMSQALNQTMLFHTYPELEAPVLDIAAGQFQMTRTLCARLGIEFVVAVLPTKCDVEWPRDPRHAEIKARALAATQLTEEDLGINRRLAVGFMERLEKLGIPCVDLLPLLQAEEGKLYWDRDYHLMPRGQGLIAAEFQRRFGDQIPRR